MKLKYINYIYKIMNIKNKAPIDFQTLNSDLSSENQFNIKSFRNYLKIEDENEYKTKQYSIQVLVAKKKLKKRENSQIDIISRKTSKLID